MRQQVFLGQLSAAGLLCAVAATFYSRLFGGPGWIGPVIGGVLLSGAMAVGLGRTSMSRPFRVTALIVAGVLFTFLAVLLPATNFGTPAEIGEAFIGSTLDGWRNTLAATLPIDTSIPEPLGFVALVAWLTGAVTGSLLVSSESSASPIIPPVLFAALSLPLGAPEGLVTFFLILGLVVGALLLGLVRAVPEPPNMDNEHVLVTEFVGERMLTERLLTGLPIVVLLGLLAPLLAIVVPTLRDDPFDPRQLREEEVQSTNAVNPLAEIKSRRNDDTPAFVLEVIGGAGPTEFDRMGFVALELYNGANWTTSSTYAATSADLDRPFEPSVDTLEVRQRIEMTDSDIPWVPAGDRPTRIEGDDLWYDEDSATLLNRSGQTNFSYEVVSSLARPTDEEVRVASIDLSDPRYTELPRIPDESVVNLLGDRLVGDTDYDRLLALQNTLREEFQLLTDESSGTSIGRIEKFLIEEEGYRDQFVSAFAVAARQRGFPTRVVVGYRITETTTDNTEVFLETITSAEYDAWPEVRFEGIGWVAFDPIPATSGLSGGNDENATTIDEGTSVRPGPTPQEAEPEEDDSPEDQNETVSATVRILIVSVLFLLFLPLVLLLLVALIKVVRRRYRESLDDPTARILAGWRESKERLIEAGVELSPDMTIKEIVTLSRRDLGVHASSPLSSLAPHVTSTIYSETAPTEHTADLVWEDVELFDRQLNETRTRLQSARAKVDPRPLLERV